MEYENIESIKKREELNRGISLSFNNRPIPIPIRFTFKDMNITLDELVNRLETMEDELQQVKSELKSYKRAEINDSTAESIIVHYITKKKIEGIGQLNIFDMAEELNLPFPQITKIMDKLKSRGVKEID